MKVLITGANGQLGLALREFYPDAIFTDREELNLLDPLLTEKVADINPDRIINCAAIVGQVDKAEDEPMESVKVNAVAVYQMLKGMRDPSGFVQISSDYVRSNNVYGITKLLSENFVLRRGGTVVRTSWLFGNGNNWVKWTLANAHKPLSIVSDQCGRPTYAKDLARAIKESEQKRGVLEIQNSGEPVSWYDYALRVCEIKGNTCLFTPTTTAFYRASRPEVAERPMNSVFEDYPGMPDWEYSLKEYINESC